MKILRKLLMKRRRRSSGEIVYGLDGSAHKDSKDVPFWRRRRSESALTLEETEGSFVADDAPWRSENILMNGSFRETDWWEEVVVDHVETTAADVNVESPEQLQVHVTTPQKKFRNRGLETWLVARQAWKDSGLSEEPSRAATTSTSSSSSTTSGDDAEDGTSSQISSSSAVKNPSPSLRRELVKNLSNNRRQYSLPKRMTLSSMIDVYQEIWNGDD